MQWRVLERVSVTDEHRLQSLFHHDAISFAYYDNPNFLPEFGNPPHLPEYYQYLQRDMESICSDSAACQYDYVVTMDRDFAKITKQSEAQAHALANDVAQGGKHD